MNKIKKHWVLLLIILIAAILRLYNLNWDNGFHLHPDERWITMVTNKVRLPKGDEWKLFLTPDSPYNPNFFAYGSLPIYLLKFAGETLSVVNPAFRTYSLLNLVGRAISAVFDLGTLVLVIILGKRLFGKRVGVLAGFFYATCVFCIQTSHFYAVDTQLTFFITLILWRCLLFFEKADRRNSIILGVVLGMGMATKITAVLVGVAVGITFLLLLVLRKEKLLTLVRLGMIIFGFSFLTFFICQPYAVIDFGEFKKQVLAQLEMGKSAFTFPFTLQYVGTTPYLYFLKNIILWGMGVVLGLITVAGAIQVSLDQIKKLIILTIKKGEIKGINKSFYYLLPILSFFWLYFIVIGGSAVKFMRYFLPLYPLFMIFGAYFVILFDNRLKMKIKRKVILGVRIMFIILILLWPASFMRIYTKPNTRITASFAINENVEPGSSFAIEHWDDRLPLFGQKEYEFIEFPLYDPDTKEKWEKMAEKLEMVDYIVVASNRLYKPITNLAELYPAASIYYERLFTGQLGFKKATEITSYPTVPFLEIEIKDDEADESFTVYDHPKVMIFKNINSEGGKD